MVVRRATRATTALLVWTALSGLAALVSLRHHLDLPRSRQLLGEVVAALASHELTGRLEIGRVVLVTPRRVLLEDVVLYDADGVEVIRIDVADGAPDLWRLLDGDIVFREVAARGGTLVLRTDPRSPDRLPSFLGAFEPARPSGGDGGGPRVVLARLSLRRIHVTGELLGRDGIDAPDVDVDGRLVIDDAVTFRVWSADGVLRGPYPFRARLLALEASIDTRDAVGIEAYAHVRSERDDADRGPDDVRARLRLWRPEGVPEDAPQHLSLRAQADPLFAETLEEVGVDLAAPLNGPLWGTVTLEGPLDRLALDVALVTEGGRVAAAGDLLGDGSVDLRVRSDDLDLGRIVRDAPTLPVAGDVRVRVVPGGETGDEAVRLEVDLDPFRFDGFQVPPIRAEGRVEPGGRVVIESLSAPQGGGVIRGSGVVDGDRVSLALGGRFPELSREPNLGRLLPGARGGLAADVDVTVEGGRFDVSGELVLTDVRQPPFAARRLVVRGRVAGDPERPRVDAEAVAEGASVAGYPLGDGTLEVHGGPRRYEARARFTAGDRRLSLDGVAERTARGLRLDADPVVVQAGPYRYVGAVQGLAIEGDDVSLEGLALVDGSQRLEASGQIRARGPDAIDATLQDVALEALLAFVPGAPRDLVARLGGSLTLRGDLRDPELDVQGYLNDGRFGAGGLAEGSWQVVYRNGSAGGGALLDLGEDGLVHVAGEGLVDRTASDLRSALLGGVYELEVTLQALEVARALALLGPDAPAFGGPITGTLRVEGSPWAPNVEGQLVLPGLRVPDGPTLPVEVTADYVAGSLVSKVRVGDAASPIATAEGSVLVDLGTLITDPAVAVESLGTLPWRVALDVPRRRLDALPGPWGEAIPWDLGPVRVEGEARFSGGSAPTDGTVDLRADWDPASAAALPCRELRDPRLRLTGRLDDGETRVTVVGYLGDAVVLQAESSSDTRVDDWVAGRAEVARPPTRLAVRVLDVPAASVPWLCERASGSLSASARAESLFTLTPTLDVSLESQDLRLGSGPRIAATLDAHVDADQGLRGSLGLRWPGNERATVTASFPVRWDPGALLPEAGPDTRLQAEAEFRAAPLAPFLLPVEEVDDVRGFLTGALTLEGPVGGFALTGSLRLDDGGVQVVPLGQQLREVSGQLDFQGNWVRIRDLRARDGDGRARVDGSVAFSGIYPRSVDVSVNASRFPLRQEGSVLARVSTNARLRGRFATDRADVDLDLRDMDVQLPEQSSRSVQALDVHPDVVVAGARRDEGAAAPVTPYPLVFDVETTDTAWVRRSDFSAEVRANLTATWVDASLRLAGSVEILRGLFEVFGKRFEVARGGLGFSGSDELDPGVSLVANHQLEGGSDTVTVIVGGTLQSPTVDFESTHPTCQADEQVIALLVSGACSVADTFATSGEEANAEQQALNFLAGITAGVLTLGARQQFGDLVPVLVIESGDQAFQSARVRAGFRADSLIPDALRGAIRGLYIEGQVTAESGDQATPQEGSGAFSGGFLLELRFPYDLVGRTQYETPSNAWSVDLTWEP